MRITLAASLCLPAVKSQADCASDCKIVIAKADKLIADLRNEIQIRKSLQEAQIIQVAQLTLQNDEKDQALNSIYRNPFFIGSSGILLGVLAGMLVHR